MAYAGIDVRATGDRIIFDAFLVDSAGSEVSTGTSNLRIYRLDSTGVLSSYDFNDNTFKTTALTTETQTMTHRTGNNGTHNTGVWTFALTTVTGFAVGDVCYAKVTNTNALPNSQFRKFQYGNAEGDLTVTSGRLNINVVAANNDANAGTRLAAALTTSSGIDVNMGQLTPGSPTADTTGEALRFAHQDLPNQIAAGAVGGLRTTPQADIELLRTTADTGSTTTQVIVPSGVLPSGVADDDYNNTLFIITDASAGQRVNFRVVSDFVASTRTFTLNSALGFTPVAGDPVSVWALNSSDILTELLKLSSGFGAASPNTLYAHVKAMMEKTASNPTGLGTYGAATDSQEALRELLDSMAGAGFLTGTDSLEEIRDAIDTLIAPAVVGSTSLSGSGFLSDCVSMVRKAIDEPSLSPKYTDTDIVGYIQDAFGVQIADINATTDHPVLVRIDVNIVPGTLTYLLPPSIGEVWSVRKMNTTTGVPEYEVWPGNEFSFTGAGFTLEGNILRLLSDWNQTITLQVLGIPNGDPFIHKATATAATSTTITMPASVTDGTKDTRERAYVGYFVRILSDANGYVQERYVSEHINTTGVLTITPAFSPTPSGTVVYEIIPQYSRLLKSVVCSRAALEILENEGNQKRIATVTAQLQKKQRALRMLLSRRNARFPTRLSGDGVDNEMRGSWWGGRGLSLS